MDKIDVNELHNINLENVKIIDVRGQKEYSFGHITGAVNIPMIELALNPYKSLNKYKKNLIISFQGGRSLKACEFLEMKGYETVHLTGGYNALENAELLITRK